MKLKTDDIFGYLIDVSVFLIFGKVFFSEPGISSAIMFLIAASYGVIRKYQESDKKHQAEELSKLQTKIEEVCERVEAYKAVQIKVEKQAEETKKIISASHLGQVFVPRNKRNQE